MGAATGRPPRVYVHVASCGRAREATRERVPAPRPLTAPPYAACRLGCVRLAHTAAQGKQLQATGRRWSRSGYRGVDV
jgi:hypothetical protein